MYSLSKRIKNVKLEIMGIRKKITVDKQVMSQTLYNFSDDCN